MTECSECHMRAGDNCLAYKIAQDTMGRRDQLQPPPLGACMIPIVDIYLTFISEGMSVLDIGCGSWDRVKSYCEEVGAHYEGIDINIEYMGKKTIATQIENLMNLSFPDESFDVVVGNQTMEHWSENGCRLGWGLYQCFRVCKPNGRVLMNVPIHFHGTRQFRRGEIKELRDLYASFSGQVSFHIWGYPSDPLPSLYAHPGYWGLKNKPAYQLDIQAVKDLPLPRSYNNYGATTGRLAQFLNYSISFNVFRALRRMGFYSRGPKMVVRE